MLRDVHPDGLKHSGKGSRPDCGERIGEEHQPDGLDRTADDPVSPRQLTYCFLRLANLDSGVFERLNRFEAALGGKPCRRSSLFIQLDNADHPVTG
jgi:hypothetical protein